jgi:rubrerythrin
MYKEFVKNSKKIGNNVAELSFTLAKKAEKIHVKIYSTYLKLLEKNKEIKFREIYICSICGNIEFDNPTPICTVCDHKQQFFKKL